MKYLRILLVVIILASFAFFIRATDLDKVQSSMLEVGFNFFWLIATTTLAYLLGTIGWKYCMGESGKHLNLMDLFLIRHVGETVSVINPTSVVGGEAMKVYLLRDKGIDRKTVIHSVLLSRAIMVLTQFGLFFGVAVFMVGNNFSFNGYLSLWQWLGPLLTILALIWLLRQNWIRQAFWATRPGAWLDVRTQAARTYVKELWIELVQFSKFNQRSLALACLFFTLHWFFGAMEFYLILKFLGLPISVLQAIFVDMGVVFFKVAGAFVPGQIGVEEYGNKIMLSAIGLPGTDVWITVSVLRRARQLFWILFGLGTYFFMYKKAGEAPPES
jgi:uncharacterized protein (TIRG00374 family)